MSNIIGRLQDIPDFNRYLQGFITEERGPVLYRTGSPKKYKYRFIDAMLECYVLIKGFDDRIIKYGNNDEG